MKPIRSEDDYTEALSRVAVLWDAGPSGRDEMEVLSILLRDWEDHQPCNTLPPPNAAGLITDRLRVLGMSEETLAALLMWPEGHIEAVLSDSMGLTAQMMRDVAYHLKFPPRLFLGV